MLATTTAAFMACSSSAPPELGNSTAGAGGSGASGGGMTVSPGSVLLGGTCWPLCANAASDPDGDGWGFENSASCVVVGSQLQASGGPCPGGSGGSSAGSVGSATGGAGGSGPSGGTGSTVSPGTVFIDGKCWPLCASAASDPDGDGWGFENNASCIVIGSQVQKSGGPCPGGSGGSSAGGAGGGAAGKAGSAGAGTGGSGGSGGRCNGLPDNCGGQTKDQCASVVGCSLRSGCTGAPTGCGAGDYDQPTCDAMPYCYYGGPTCSPIAGVCGVLADQATCALLDGCYWDPTLVQCQGTAQTCDTFNQVDCAKQQGCYWTNEKSCTGTETECETFDATQCSQVSGCQISGGICLGPGAQCHAYQTALSCDTAGGCAWSNASGCYSVTDSCNENVQYGSCVDAGCMWVDACAGTAAPCPLHDSQTTCAAQPGCVWQ